MLVSAVLILQASATGSVCPVMLVSGTGERDAMVITFRNAGKLPIRRLEFNCTPVRGHSGKRLRRPCREENALFYPGPEYTVRYPYPGGRAEPVVVSLRSVKLSDGTVWKPSKRQPCRALRIVPLKNK